MKRFIKTLSWTYKVLRSILFTLILTAVGIAVLLYILLSIPPIHDKIRDIAQEELTAFFGQKVEIEHLQIVPFNEVILEDVAFTDPYGEKCLQIEKLGGGINLFRLIFKGEIEITYIELLDFNANIYQIEKDSPLNIDYIVKAFEPKDKNKPPTKFDLKIHNIVLRGGAVAFDRRWEKTKEEGIDFNHLKIADINADIALPKLSNDLYQIDLRRLAFTEKNGLIVKEIGGYFTVTPKNLAVNDFILQLPETVIHTDNFNLPLTLFTEQTVSQPIRLKIYDSQITPSDLASFVPSLQQSNYPVKLEGVIKTNLKDIQINAFTVSLPDQKGSLALDVEASNFQDIKNISIQADNISFDINTAGMTMICDMFDAGEKIPEFLGKLGYAKGKITGSYDAVKSSAKVNANIDIAPGSIDLAADVRQNNDIVDGKISLKTPAFNISEIADQKYVTSVSDVMLELEGEINTKNILQSNAKANFSIGAIDILSRQLDHIQGNISKAASKYDVDISIEDDDISGSLVSSAIIDKGRFNIDLTASVRDFDAYNSLLTESVNTDLEFRGNIDMHAEGTGIHDASGRLEISDLYLFTAGKEINFDQLLLSVNQMNPDEKVISLQSSILDFTMTGDYDIPAIPKVYRQALSEISPSIFPHYEYDGSCGSGQFTLEVKDANPIIEFFSLPIIPLTELTIYGDFDGDQRSASVHTEIPYIQQGKNKLITGTYLDLELKGVNEKLTLDFGTIYPTKKGDLKLDVNLIGHHGEYALNLGFNKGLKTSFHGETDINVRLGKDEMGRFNCMLDFLPSSLYLNGSEWKIEEATLEYSPERLEIDNLSIRHDGQFVIINGYNDRDGEGTISVQLADISLDYIFDTLNINHVSFGGLATGEILASGLLLFEPDIRTKQLNIENLSYNNAVLGNGDIESSLNLEKKMVEIKARIDENDERVANVDGGVWFGRDSLSFDFDANKINIGFLQPFMKAFSSSVTGKASGKAKLYGTFSDIDLTGKVMAQDAAILIDYTNVTYTATDTVYLYPGRIEVPGVTIRDKNGNTAKVNGYITHQYFHYPAFQFTVSDMERLLAYDTSQSNNRLWYGTVYAKGIAEITGKPGLVSIAADVESEEGSSFTFVLSDQLEAVKTNFLTFSDKRKEAYEASIAVEEEEEIPEFLKKFYTKKPTVKQESAPDIFTMDLRATVTPDLQFNLIMDPVAGDKIVAYGEGAMNMEYSSQTDDLKLFGKYILDKGTYNFSLQDIILKDFTIKPGSSIAFTGNPYNATLDLTAAYRVNTSLTELDQSFATDKELNRTSVPVEALLKVSGQLLSPTIGFDIELPTVTEETARKVKSIISTDDMMSRQVIYLVALNKFYPPEYMTTSGSGGEWASIASSTISSQLQNIIGQITDKFTLAPSIRSDKGDFSDLEVDIALSSNLFNNRLLLNGNLGYRDPSNSSTMFVGDFDLEYLLNPSGTWRLKAYNHFNDQNYYLKSALTTQGIGIVWRKDFGYLNGRKKKKEEESGKDKETDDKNKSASSGEDTDK